MNETDQPAVATDDDDGAQPILAAATSDDGLPGVALSGYPGLCAGAFGFGNGALGMYRAGAYAVPIAGSQYDPRLIQAAYFGKGPDVLPDYITKSWRWNDPGAVNYNLDRKRGQYSQATGMANAANAIADIAEWVPIMPSGVPKGLHAFGKYMEKIEGAHLQDQIDALQDRKRQ